MNPITEKLANLFCPWMLSDNKPGTKEYAKEVQEMLESDGFPTKIVKDGDTYYCEPAERFQGP